MGNLRRRILLKSVADTDYLIGVYAYYSDGSLRTYNRADSNAIGVAVLTPICQFVISKYEQAKAYFGGYNKDLSSAVPPMSTESKARKELTGEKNTVNIINACAGYTDSTYHITGAPAAEACRTMFDGNGYIGAFGEWYEAYKYKSDVDNMMTKIGGDTFAEAYTSSTIPDASEHIWAFFWSDGHGANPTRRVNVSSRAFLRIKASLFIDLGLPSGTLWAAGNICKDTNGNYYMGSPTDYGAYFSWGNIDGHSAGEGYNWGTEPQGPYASTSGSLLDSDISSSDAEHDAALAYLGKGHRMPTKDDVDELFNNCTYTWTTDYNGSGVTGTVFKSNVSGFTDREIFIPAAGFGYGTDTPMYGGAYARCWTSTYYSDRKSYMLGTRSSGRQGDSDRYRGNSVRAVKSE